MSVSSLNTKSIAEYKKIGSIPLLSDFDGVADTIFAKLNLPEREKCPECEGQGETLYPNKRGEGGKMKIFNGSWWIIALCLFIMYGVYMQGYCMGKRYAETHNIIYSKGVESVYKINPNTDPKYKDLKEKGYKWVEKWGWVK